MANEQDTRYKSAEQAIEIAFWRLMETDGFDAMTATQIIQLAGVNRSTFYAHYAGKRELLDRQVDRLLEKLASAASHAPVTHEGPIAFTGSELIDYVTNMATILEQDTEKYQTLLPGHAELLRGKIDAAVHTVWQRLGIAKTFTVPEHYVRAAVCGMVSSLVVEWFSSESARTPEQFADVALSLIAPLARAVTSKPQ